MAKRGRKSEAPRKAAIRQDLDLRTLEATGYLVPPPAGVNLDTTEKSQLWGQYTSFKEPAQWPEKDLLRLAEIIELDVGIRALLPSAASAWGSVEVNSKGVTTTSGELRAVKIMMDARNNLLRILGLNIMARATTLENNALSSTDRQRTQRLMDNGDLDDDSTLLAGYD